MQNHGALESEWDEQPNATQLLRSFQGFANKVPFAVVFFVVVFVIVVVVVLNSQHNYFDLSKGLQIWCQHPFVIVFVIVVFVIVVVVELNSQRSCFNLSKALQIRCSIQADIPMINMSLCQH